ncbi:MAG: hypothetical protein Q8936_23955, partial [Bacillota bacterium]|nr:hypothetical protein [Bacillota bacterium]
VFLAYNFLEIFRCTDNHKSLNTIGEVQEHLNSLSARDLVCFVYKKSKQCVPLEDILLELKIA